MFLQAELGQQRHFFIFDKAREAIFEDIENMEQNMNTPSPNQQRTSRSSVSVFPEKFLVFSLFVLSCSSRSASMRQAQEEKEIRGEISKANKQTGKKIDREREIVRKEDVVIFINLFNLSFELSTE